VLCGLHTACRAGEGSAGAPAADKKGNGPRLEIQATGSNRRLHEAAWRRPFEIDLLRCGFAETQTPE